MGGFEVMPNNMLANQVLAASLGVPYATIDLQEKLNQDFMVRSPDVSISWSLDWMSGFKVMADKVSASQVPAA